MTGGRTYSIAQGDGEWVIFDGETGRRVTSFCALAYAVACVVALLDGAFDRPTGQGARP